MSVNGNRSSAPVIQTRDLSKSYGRGDKLALNRLNLDVYEGEIFGYLGPNGAGKSTTIRMLMDLIRPTSGDVKVFGLDARKDAVEIHKRVGFLPGEMNLWPNYTGAAVVRYFSSVHGNVDPAYVQQLTRRLELDLSIKVRQYSTGNKRKLGLLLSMMHRPDLLILDEPSSGLDPLMQQVFNDLMREQRAAGRTVFLSSHVLNEVQAICDRVAILRGGVLQEIDRVDKLTHTDFRWVRLTFRAPVPQSKFVGIDGISDVEANGNQVKLRVTGDFDPVIRAIGPEYVVDMVIQEPSLEEIFLAFYGEKSPVVAAKQ
jgi:ABC-2 type transport system ATP-binding protein